MRYTYFAIFLLLLLPIVYAETSTKVGTDELYDIDNVILGTQADKLGAIIPAVMLIVAIVCLMLDFGVIGVTVGGILSLIALWAIKILPMKFSGILSIIILAIILLFKLRA